MRSDTAAPEGFALPVALFALIVIGAIVTGGVFVAQQETRIGVSSDLASDAFAVAEYGLQDVLATWHNKHVMNAASAGTTYSETAWAGSRYLGRFDVTVDSLRNRLYLIRVDGTANRGPDSTTRSVGALVRTTSAGLPYESALSILGTLSVEGQSDVVGTDGCDPTHVVPGVTATATSQVSTAGSGTVDGNPAVDAEPTMDQTTLSQYGDVDLQDLIDSATKVYPDGANPTNMEPETTTDGAGNTICDTSVLNNWGDTIDSNPCGDYYPLIYGEGDLTINGAGSGAMAQGILVVEGDLVIDGNVKFEGVVITKGDLYYAGHGGHVEGAMIVMGNTSSTSAGNAELNYNSCAVEDAFNGTLRTRPLESRSWVDLDGTIRPL